jgi:hypothetical protein
VENYIVQKKIDNIFVEIQRGDIYKTLYGLPDLTQLFAFNQIEFAIINQAEISFNDVCEVCIDGVNDGVNGFLSKYKIGDYEKEMKKQYFVTFDDDFVVFKFYVPSSETVELKQHTKYNDDIAILVKTAYSSTIAKIQLGDNRQNKLIVKQIRVQKTLEFLIEMVNEIIKSNIQSENVNTLLNELQEHIVKIVKEQVDNLEGLANKDEIQFNVQNVKNTLSVYLDKLFRKDPQSINIDMYENAISQDEDVCYSQMTEIDGGKRASTRGRRVVQKRQTKRNGLKKRNKRTIKHKRKKHRTVKRGARK